MTMVPASSLAAEIGNPRLANVVLLGTPSHSLDIPVEIWDGTMGDRVEDKYKRAADHRAGAYSILVGVAANRSIETGKLVRIDDLVRGVERPDFTAMPSPDDPTPLGDPSARRVSPEEAVKMQEDTAHPE